MRLHGLTESDLRGAVCEMIDRQNPTYDGTRVIEELGLLHGRGRVDIAVIDGEVHGYELKSFSDNLSRLPRQAALFSTVLDRATLVVDTRHFPRVVDLVPEWWGIQTAAVTKLGIELLSQRPSLKNPTSNSAGLLKLLWRSEALNFLEKLGQRRFRSKTRKAIYEEILRHASAATIQREVRERLVSRHNWKPDALRMQDGD